MRKIEERGRGGTCLVSDPPGREEIEKEGPGCATGRTTVGTVGNMGDECGEPGITPRGETMKVLALEPQGLRSPENHKEREGDYIIFFYFPFSLYAEVT